MMHNNINSTRELANYYFKNILNITRELKTIPIVWEELFDDNIDLDPNVVVQVWKENFKYTIPKVNIKYFIIQLVLIIRYTGLLPNCLISN